MKKQQKLQHQQPSRKSGRLSSSAANSSSSPSTRSSGQAKPGPESRPGDAWALSLHVVEEQQPLSICNPFLEEDNSVRRSSRFTANKYKTPPPESSRSRSRLQKHTALGLSELRKSPRLVSSSSAPALTLTVGEDMGSLDAAPKKRRRILALPEPDSRSGSRGCLSERCLRSRTVLMRVGDGGDLNVSQRRLRSRVVRYAVVEPPSALEKSAVRSGSGERREKGKGAAKNAGDSGLIELPHINESAISGRNVSETPRIEMLPWPEKSPVASVKCLRSRTVKMQMQEETGASVKTAYGVGLNKKKGSVTPKKEPSLGESANVSEKREGQSDKQLRSRKIQFKVNVDENAVRVAAPIEGGSSGQRAVKSEKNEKNTLCGFIGEPIQEEVAQKRWQWRYDLKVINAYSILMI